MQYSTILLATLASITSAQVVYNSTTGVFSCPTVPNGAYCAGDSLATNIILRCVNGTAYPGNCNDNLDGYFPIGLNGATCYQPDTISGTAACAKNCIVEGGSGNSPTFTLPNCTPLVESSTSSAAASSTTAAASTTATSTSASTTITSTGTSTYTVDSTTITETFTTTYCPESTTTTAPTLTSTSTTIPLSTFTTIPLSTGGTTTYSNGTTTASSTIGGVTTSTSATAVPVGPTTTTTGSGTAYTGAAVANSAGMGLSVLGLFVAYFL